MKMRVLIFLAIALSACATEIPEPEKKDAAADSTHSPEKRQAQEGTYSQLQYRTARKQEQVAPVEESQDDDKGLRNRTSSLQPSSEKESAIVDRPPREQPPNPPENADQTTTAPGSEKKKTYQASSMKQVNVEVVKDQANQVTQQISIEHRGLSLEDRRQSHIPPPRDGKSYTPEEFTSLIIAGFAVTPVPDFNGFDGFDNSVNSMRHPASYSSTPLPYQNQLVTSTLAPVHHLREQSLKIDQARLLGHYRQSLETLPPPKNRKFYTPEEYNGLLAAGYPVTAVPVPLTFGELQSSQSDAQEYRPGQVFSLNAQELLDLQPERKAPVSSGQLLQQLYVNPQQEHKQNLQQIYYLEPQQQSGRQVPPSHAVIARPQYNFNGGEASVGAALSVSDTGASSTDSFDQELLALLGQPQVRAEPHQGYSPAPQQFTTVRSVAPQYQQVDRYVSKPSKKSSKLRSKVHVSFPQPTEAPQQYLIETTNVQQQQQPQPQYRPTPPPQRLAQSLRYVPIAQAQAQQEFAYERPEAQGLKIVPAPKLQQVRAPLNYRVAPQYQQQEASPKQYRIVELPQQLRPQALRQELRFPPSSSIERPVAYLKRYPELEKQRSVKIYDPVAETASQQQVQLYGEQFVLRPIYRTNEQQQPRYELSAKPEQVNHPTKPPHSAIYVSKNLPAPRKIRPQPAYREQSEVEQVNIEQHGRNLDEQRSFLPPPKNNKAYTPEEFAALVAAGYSVTPVPVSAANLEGAQSRISEESVTPQPKRRLSQRRRNQYLPVRDDAP